MFDHHFDADATPEEPAKLIEEVRTDEELDTELAELEVKLGDGNEKIF